MEPGGAIAPAVHLGLPPITAPGYGKNATPMATLGSGNVPSSLARRVAAGHADKNAHDVAQVAALSHSSKDAAYTFGVLQHELIRHHHFHKRIDDDAMRHARRKGRVQLREAVRVRLERYL